MSILQPVKYIAFSLLLILPSPDIYSSEYDHTHHSHKEDSHATKPHDQPNDHKHGSPEKDDHDDENKNRFELSKKAIKLMKIEVAKLKSLKKEKFSAPRSALLRFGEKYGIYKYDGEHFELIEISNVLIKKSSIIFKAKKINAHDQVVIQGVPLLRVSHLQASGQGGQGHAH